MIILALWSGVCIAIVCAPVLLQKGRGFRLDDLRDALAKDFWSFVLLFYVAVLAIPGLRLRSQTRRLLAIRGIRARHFWLSLALVLPLSVFAGYTARLINQAARHEKVSAWTNPAEKNAAPGNMDQDPWEPDDEGEWVSDDVNWLSAWPESRTLLFLAIVIVAPLSEEVFFRGFLGRGLVGRYGIVAGVTLTSLWFGLLHLDSLGKIVGATILGIGLHPFT
jgi:membrane protease YdiL (CAAX protease family)